MADPADIGQGSVTLLLCAGEPTLVRAWGTVRPPAGFRLARAPAVEPSHFAGADPLLVLVDAETALGAEGPLGEALQRHAGRCVWVGPPETLARLGPGRIEEAYDVLPTPTGEAVLQRRLANWRRNIEQTGALAEIGRRIEDLAAQNDRLAAKIAEVEAQAAALGRQRERLDQALRRIRQVAALSREINCLDLERITKVCIERLPALVEAKRASLYFYDAAEDRLVLQGHTHNHPIAERVDLGTSTRSPMAVAVRRGELLLIREFREFEQARDLVLDREFREQYATASCIIVPLKGGGRVHGVLNLADKQGGGRFDEEIDLPVVEQIAELIGASIYNVELYREMERRAKTDLLTGLANRRAVEEALAREIDRSRRYGDPLSVLLMDVDGLKRINDAHGHEAGDAVLRKIASLLADAVRSVDVPGRWGGDEFLVALPDTSASQARRLAKRLLRRVHDDPARIGDTPLESGLSVGLAEYDRKESVADLLRRADQALYEAKRAGRDRVVDADGQT